MTYEANEIKGNGYRTLLNLRLKLNRIFFFPYKIHDSMGCREYICGKQGKLSISNALKSNRERES